MKRFHKVVLVAVVMLIGLAFLPLAADAFSEEFGWEKFEGIYRQFEVFLPAIFSGS